jgi:hypothetical protein
LVYIIKGEKDNQGGFEPRKGREKLVLSFMGLNKGGHMEKSVIEDEIDFAVGITTYDIWRIGVAQELSILKKQLSDDQKHDTTYWSAWAAESLSDAKEIESRCIGRGMKSGASGRLSSNGLVYVYIY